MAIKPSKQTKPLEIPRFIVLFSKVIAFLSTKLVTAFTFKLFTTPIRHKTPKREMELDQKSIQTLLTVPSINKKIVVYQYGVSEKKVLLVHGWSGRGTQLCKIADELLKSGYSTVSFDAPAHGKSPGNSSIMVDFIDSILEIDKLYGPFEIAIGHSLGGMSVLNAIKKGFFVKRAVLIGSGDIVQDIIDDFIKKLELKPEISTQLCLYIENKYGGSMDDYSAYRAASNTEIPTLVIHDENDPEVPVKAGIHIHKHLKNAELMITKELGHRKILADHQVIEKIINFIKK
ncbi:alpha/beta hydrolase [Flavobacterium sp. ZT3R18]|uniref:alpha/beta hydrolase n=1 Tax=Flavobacterium sp. ZT3R18 TaxID=2594429 RepID=UPI00117A2E21|nr:alpha/beta hydrolase [Flavobacterium sp. ZT3R18]TRX35816.1 alpha/beta hydrolase [Flavobacterium sp. ZT3R18]